MHLIALACGSVDPSAATRDAPFALDAADALDGGLALTADAADALDGGLALTADAADALDGGLALTADAADALDGGLALTVDAADALDFAAAAPRTFAIGRELLEEEEAPSSTTCNNAVRTSGCCMYPSGGGGTVGDLATRPNFGGAAMLNSGVPTPVCAGYGLTGPCRFPDYSHHAVSA